MNKSQDGFIVTLLLGILIGVAVAAIGWFVWNHHQTIFGHTVGQSTYQVGDTFLITLNGPYWSDLSFTPTGVVSQVSRDPAATSCLPPLGCKSVTFGVRAMSKGSVVITDTRPQCGEAMACTGNAGTFSTRITVE